MDFPLQNMDEYKVFLENNVYNIRIAHKAIGIS